MLKHLRMTVELNHVGYRVCKLALLSSSKFLNRTHTKCTPGVWKHKTHRCCVRTKRPKSKSWTIRGSSLRKPSRKWFKLRTIISRRNCQNVATNLRKSCETFAKHMRNIRKIFAKHLRKSSERLAKQSRNICENLLKSLQNIREPFAKHLLKSCKTFAKIFGNICENLASLLQNFHETLVLLFSIYSPYTVDLRYLSNIETK